MSRNVTILIIILIVILLAGYLVWLRSKFAAMQPAAVITPAPIITIAISPPPAGGPTIASVSASPSATVKPSPATKQKVTPTKAASNSGKNK